MRLHSKARSLVSKKRCQIVKYSDIFIDIGLIFLRLGWLFLYVIDITNYNVEDHPEVRRSMESLRHYCD